jgi:hypothetical protein
LSKYAHTAFGSSERCEKFSHGIAGSFSCGGGNHRIAEALPDRERSVYRSWQSCAGAGRSAVGVIHAFRWRIMEALLALTLIVLVVCVAQKQ